MQIVETHTVPAGAAHTRVENYIHDVFEIFPSRKSARKAIKRGIVRLNGEIPSTGTWIHPGQVLELIDDDRTPPKSYRIPLRVVFEDNWLAVIEKPPGILVNGNCYRTVENALSYNLTISEASDALKWPKPVHRLDKPTGGLLIVAKTLRVLSQVSEQLHDRRVQKRYRAIVLGRLDGSGCISDPLDGKHATTQYQSIRRVPSLTCQWLTLVDLWPQTGRYHQLRRHLASLGHPILGDSEYTVGGKVLRSKGLFLWSVEVSFRHPILQHGINIQINEAKKFTTFLQREQKRWKRYNAS